MNYYDGVKEVPKTSRRVYKYEEQLHRKQLITNTFMQKFLVDPKEELSNRRKKAMLREDNDGMLFGVRYSVNKHGRWKKATAENLLPGKQKKDIDVAFVDHAYALLYVNDATSVSFLNEDDSISTVFPKQRTSQYLNLLYNASGKTKTELTSPRIEYIVHTIHPTPTKLRKESLWRGRKSRYWYGWAEKDCGAKNEKYLEDRLYCGCVESGSDHMEPCPWRFGTLESEEEEEEGEKEEKRRKYLLNLEDCIRHPENRQRTEKRKRRRENTENDFEIVENKDIEMDCISIDSETSPSLLKVAPFRTDNMKKGLFERVLIGTEKWTGISLEEEVEILADGDCEICWLNSDRTRVTIDASRALWFPEANKHRSLVVTVEEAKNGEKGFTFNSTYSPPSAEDFIKLQNILSQTTNLKEFMEKTVKKFRLWKKKSFPLPSSDFTHSDCLTSRFTRRPYLFSRQVNSTMYSERAVVIDQPELDRIIGNLFPSECDGSAAVCNTNLNGNTICSYCGSKENFDLFEANNLLFCWTCLHNMFQRKMETPFLNQKCSISLPDGLKISQILPLFVPISTIYDYANYMVVKNWDFFYNKPRWINCPCCANLLETRTTESFHSTLCPVCHIIFCANCLQEEHFPMNCEEKKKWTEIFDTQVAFNITGTTEVTFLRFTCSCGAWIETDLLSEYAQCPGCFLEFNPSTQRLRSPRNRTFEKYRFVRKNIPKRHLRFDHNGVITVPINHLYEKKMRELAVECHLERLNAQKRKQFKSAVRNLFKESIPEMTRALDLRNTVLSRIKNTIGWLKMHKTPVEVKIKIVKLLKEIKRIYDNILVFLDKKETESLEKFKILYKKVSELDEYLRNLEEWDTEAIFSKHSAHIILFKEGF